MSDNKPQITAPVGNSKPIPAPPVRLVATTEPGLIKMTKGDETLFVHPTAVRSHEIVGWTVCH